MDARWEIDFVGFGELERGDVVTKDGMRLGGWEVDHTDHTSFTPLNESAPIFSEQLLTVLCEKIAQWLEEREGHVDPSSASREYIRIERE